MFEISLATEEASVQDECMPVERTDKVQHCKDIWLVIWRRVLESRIDSRGTVHTLESRSHGQGG